MKRIIALCAVVVLAGVASAQPRAVPPGPPPAHGAGFMAFLLRCGLGIACRDCFCGIHHMRLAECWHRHGARDRHVFWYPPPGRHQGRPGWQPGDGSGRRSPGYDGRGYGHGRHDHGRR